MDTKYHFLSKSFLNKSNPHEIVPENFLFIRDLLTEFQTNQNVKEQRNLFGD